MSLVKNIERIWPTKIPSDYIFAYDPAFSPTDPELVAFHRWTPPQMSWDGSEIVLFNRTTKKLTIVAVCLST